jgi:energy-coupling factor transporter transmembrane protein EcfT
VNRPAPDAAPLLLGALGGSLVAGRPEVALACVAAGVAAGARAGARWPPAAGLRLLALGRSATAEGLAWGVLLALRLAGAAVAVAGLAAAWPGERAADELARLASPLGRLGLPIGEARAIAGLALRFAPLLRDEARRVGALQALRAGRPPHGWTERVTRGRAAFVPALVGALERAERVALGLEARHHRVRPLPPGVRAPAWAVAAGVMLFGAALAWRGR